MDIKAKNELGGGEYDNNILFKRNLNYFIKLFIVYSVKWFILFLQSICLLNFCDYIYIYNGPSIYVCSRNEWLYNSLYHYSDIRVLFFVLFF